MHPARFERDLPIAAQIEIAVPDMDVAVAHPCRLDTQQHLLAFGFGVGILPRFQGLSPFDDLHRTHTDVPQASFRPLTDYSITSSASARINGGTVMPSPAVLRSTVK